MICGPYDMQIADDLYVVIPCFYAFFIIMYSARAFIYSLHYLLIYTVGCATRADCGLFS
jgi:hypothetical protein